MNFAALREKAEKAASKYTPSAGVVRPAPGASQPGPAALALPQRAEPNTVAPPPPIRRASSNAGPPPQRAAKPAHLSRPPGTVAPPAPPSRRTTAVAEPARPTPAPPYDHAVHNDMPGPLPTNLAPPRAARPQQLQEVKPYTQFTEEDKLEMFSYLDDYFSRLGLSGEVVPSSAAAAPLPAAPRRQALATTAPAPAATPPAPVSYLPPTLDHQPPASIPSGEPPTRPYPLNEPCTSLLLLRTLLAFPGVWFDPSTFSTPPPLQGRQDVSYSTSWGSQTRGRETTTTMKGTLKAGDGSSGRWEITWSSSAPQQAAKQAWYRPPPSAAFISAEDLYAGSEAFGPAVAGFAEGHVSAGQPAGTGECWDLANLGLQAAPGAEGTVGRCFGFCLFYFDANAGTREGLWRGGDDYVRPGDVVEWRKARITTTLPGGGWSETRLGDPDHTAVVLSVGGPTAIPGARNGEGEVGYAPGAVGRLELAEQSQGKRPERRWYNFGEVGEGQVWVMRPMKQGWAEEVTVESRV